jgi:hypothetical protein
MSVQLIFLKKIKILKSPFLSPAHPTRSPPPPVMPTAGELVATWGVAGKLGEGRRGTGIVMAAQGRGGFSWTQDEHGGSGQAERRRAPPGRAPARAAVVECGGGARCRHRLQWSGTGAAAPTRGN